MIRNIPKQELEPFMLDQASYLKLKRFFVELFILKNEAWPEKSLWPKFSGLPAYQVDIMGTNSKSFLLIRFSRPVCRQDKPAGVVYRIGEGNELFELF